ncbi:hypothetical protein [Tateyamaria pelophila]|uniref:hypothetical protein n=1 Tax=Tateyamaria pelophila TaxID=328415 RepID=UPI001CBFFCDB|nr:hypothetical protein [Tateyamaria pelophila]
MTKFLSIIAVSAIGLTAATEAYAQALVEARARLACGKDKIVDAVYLPGNLLRVTCADVSEETPSQEDSLLNNGEPFTLAPPLVALGIAGVLSVITGGGGSSTTSTSPAPAGQ